MVLALGLVARNTKGPVMGRIKPGVTIRGSGRAGRGDDPHGVTSELGYPEAHDTYEMNPEPEEQRGLRTAANPVVGVQGWID